MDTKHHCNSCPHWYVTQKQYPSGFYDITICRKYGKQIYYLAGDKNRTPYPCSICEKEFSYVPYMEQELLQEVKQVTTHEIVKEIVSQGKVDEIYKILSDMILRQKAECNEEIKEYRASLIAIRKINKGKNEAIDALSDI